MNKEELQKWIERTEWAIENQEYLIKQDKEKLEFNRKILKEIKKIKKQKGVIN